MTTLGRTRRLFLIMSITCCLFSNSWIIVWMALEVNTISFCAILLFIISKETTHKESIIKYFMVQSMASALLLLRRSYEMEGRTFMTVWIILAILMKMGRVPFHQWFINTRSALSLMGASMLITTQKILPIFLTSLVKRRVFLVFAVINIVLGAISQYYTKKLLTILSLSSVANLGWLIVASQLCTNTIWTIVTIYMANVILVFVYMSKKERKETNKRKGDTVSVMLLLSSLAGIPPLMVFLPKWIVAKEIIEQRILVPIILLLTISSVRIYIYLRIFTPIIITSPSLKGKWSGLKPLNALFVLTLALSTVII